MRRLLLPVVMAVGLAGWSGGAAFAQAPAPGSSPAGAPAVPGKKVCTIDDERLVELSGLIATADGYIVVNDSTDIAAREKVFLLNKKCDVRQAISYAGNGPRDPEDLALSPDGKTLWIADIGDNEGKRETVALWRMPVNGSTAPQLYRLKYPDGAKDAEALLMGADGLPIIITKGAKAALYKPTAAPKRGGTTPLQKAGEITLPRTGTDNPLGTVGRFVVTGGAVAPDGSRVVLRTYADAFEWDVKGGDIVAGLTSGEPRITPLPNEPRGESISYSADGATFVTVSETVQEEGLDAVILRYTPAKAVAKPTQDTAAPGGGSKDTRSFLDKLDLGDITALIGAVGVFGVLLVAAGVIGIVLARRRPQAPDLDGVDPDDDAPVRAAAAVPEEYTEFLARVPDEPRYGAARPSAAVNGAPAGAVYGASAGPGAGGDRPGGGVYGAPKGSGAVYGGGGGYRAGREADYRQRPERGAEYRSGGVYGGQEYGPSARQRSDIDRRADHGGYAGAGYDYPDDGYAEQPAAARYPDDGDYGPPNRHPRY